MKLTSGVRERERQQAALDRLIVRYQKAMANFGHDNPYLTRLAGEIENLKRKIGV